MKNKRVLKVLSAVLSGILLLETPMSALATETARSISEGITEEFIQEESVTKEETITEDASIVEDNIEPKKQETLIEESFSSQENMLEEENLLELELLEQKEETVLLSFRPQETLAFYELYRQAGNEEEEVLLAELEEVELQVDGTCFYVDEISDENIYTYWIYGYEEKSEEEMLPLAFGGFVETESVEEQPVAEEIFENEETVESEEELEVQTEETAQEDFEIEKILNTEFLEEEASAVSMFSAEEAVESVTVIEEKETTSSNQTSITQTQTAGYLAQQQASVGTVRNLTAEVIAYNKIKITWDKIEGAKGYYIYYKTSNMGYELLKTQGGNSYTFSKAVCGVDYSFKVSAYTKVGNTIDCIAESEVGPVKTELDVPVLTVSKVGYTQAVLKWKKVTGAKKYEIEFSNSENGNYNSVNTVTSKAITGTSYTHKQDKDAAGKTYYYKIRAVLNEKYATEWSKPIRVTLNQVEVTKGKVENLNAEVIAYNKIKLTWNKQSKANGYEIRYTTSENTSYENCTVLKTQGSNSYTFNNAECGKTYYFYVRAYQKVDGITHYGIASDKKSAKADLVTSSLQVAKVSYTQAALKWSKVTGATEYILSISESKNGPYTEVAKVKTTSYTQKGLTPGKTYYYKVNVIRNNYTGGDSNVVEAKLPYIEVSMSSVKNLTATQSTYNTIKIGWDKLTGAKGYQLFYKTALDAEYELLKTQTTNSYIFNNAECGVTYYFSVQAYQTIDGDVFYGEYSQAAAAKTELEFPVPSISSVAYNKVVLKWEKITGATSYEVYVSDSQNGTYALAGTTTDTSYTDKNVEINKTYYYKVKAVRNNYSTELSAATDGATILYGDLTNLKAKSTDDGKIKISWKSVPGMTNYVIERYTSEEDAYNGVNEVSFETASTSYTDSGLKLNTTYYYMVYGENASYQTNVEGPVSAKTKIVEQEEDNNTNYVRYGVDVSSYQGKIDWNKVYDSNIRFAMLRILVKSGNKDVKFEENYTNARKAGVKVGVYKYTYATNAAEATAEAKAVIAALNGRKLDYPVALDLEDTVQEKLTNAQRTEIVLAYKKVVEAAGYKFVVYASKYWFDAKLDMNRLADVELWIARWRNLSSGHGYTGKGKVTMWQYSDAGTVNGISGRVDLDVSYKKY